MDAITALSGTARPRHATLRLLCRVSVVGSLAIAACSQSGPDSDAGKTLVDPPPITSALSDQLESWFTAHGSPPEEYLLGLFEDHDVVILGEQHRILHDVALVQKLIPRLPSASVSRFATEFATRRDQTMVDSLVFGEDWDEQLGRSILFRQFVAWGFREYVDILKAVWQSNAQYGSADSSIQVIAVNNTMDYSHFRSEADWNDDEVWNRVFGDQTEADWAAPILKAVHEGNKVLVHCGIHHGFTSYRQPMVENGEFIRFGRMRMGNVLHDSLGTRVVTVYLHAPWNTRQGYTPDFVHPAEGRLDAYMLSRAGGPYPVGFDVAASPLGDLPIENSVYALGYEPFTLSMFCDGWIYRKPIHEYETVHYIDGWINEDNLEEARARAMNPRWRTMSVGELEAGCRSYQEEFRRFYGRLR
ncbi:MAG: hypothetical protein R3E12_18660 [Candidatus Eisenbacteria bacterium]